LENQILKEAMDIAASKKWIALAVVAGGPPMKSVCSALDVERSNLHVRHHRPVDWQDGRSGRTPAQDGALLADPRRHIAEIPSYGYRRAGALLNLERRSEGQAVLNHKRIYRIMARHQLLLGATC
jgi:putative transposase